MSKQALVVILVAAEVFEASARLLWCEVFEAPGRLMWLCGGLECEEADTRGCGARFGAWR